jgi:hypothetical protein
MKWSHWVKLFRLRKKTGELVVTTRFPPWLRLLVIGLAVLALVVGGGMIYDHGLNMAGFESSLATQRRNELQNDLRRLQNENAELRDSLARAQRTLQMNQVAYQELERALDESASSIVKLRDELSFYKTILSADNKIIGLQIHSLKIERASGDNEYRYKLVLVQSFKHDQSVTGSGRLEVSGSQDGAPAVLHFPETGAPIRINFKYFQDSEGVLKLPKSFKPQRIKAVIVTGGTNPQTVEQIYSWPVL